MRQRLRVCVHPLRRARRGDRRRKRPPVVMCGEPMTRELPGERGITAVEPFRMLAQQFGEARMQFHSLTGQEIVVDHLVDERVPEAIGHAVCICDQDLMRHRGSEALQQLQLGQL